MSGTVICFKHQKHQAYDVEIVDDLARAKMARKYVGRLFEKLRVSGFRHPSPNLAKRTRATAQ
jgi:hypothetical protein